MQLIYKRIILQLIGAIIASFILIAFYLLIERVVDTSRFDFGGDKSGIFIAIFAILPIGSLAGIYLVDRQFFSFQGYNLVGIVIGFILSFLVGGITSVLLLDKLGFFAAFLVPFIIVGLSLLGYYLPFMPWRD
jgi:glycerol uptake facilitator-like aquaporin